MRSLEASNALINRCAEHLCSNLAAYAREGRETNIWRDFGGHMRRAPVACAELVAQS